MNYAGAQAGLEAIGLFHIAKPGCYSSKPKAARSVICCKWERNEPSGDARLGGGSVQRLRESRCRSTPEASGKGLSSNGTGSTGSRRAAKALSLLQALGLQNAPTRVWWLWEWTAVDVQLIKTLVSKRPFSSLSSEANSAGLRRDTEEEKFASTKAVNLSLENRRRGSCGCLWTAPAKFFLAVMVRD
ncbi:uncharacterized protein LOC112973693 isoform X2 [Apteryx rowi]|uniref:uncharacterized protein LOC112973693 isoform X2 n=1 Tax=Apteryx rowi TaxID=308060 RepID=UPI000E1D1A0D|nr:uncharacterized protein LOC112973693 isoform X2 [Apteryx rowi]